MPKKGSKTKVKTVDTVLLEEDSTDTTPVSSVPTFEDLDAVKVWLTSLDDHQRVLDVYKHFTSTFYPSRMKELTSGMTDLQKMYNLIQDKQKRSMNVLRKEQTKRLKRQKVSSGKTKEYGFNTTEKLPTEIHKFLKKHIYKTKSEVEVGKGKKQVVLKLEESMRRPDVTKLLYFYIDKKNLKDPDDKRIIHPDANIKKLFKLSKGEELHFKNFQTHLSNVYNSSKDKAAKASV